MSKPKATPAQRQCLQAVHGLTTDLGRSPSTKEVAEALGCSKPTARMLMKTCTEKGLVRAPKAVVEGEWAVTAAGRKELERGE
jgi:Mn-dependent DtxR family transcriptional regulator